MDCPRNECKMKVYLILRRIESDVSYYESFEAAFTSKQKAKLALDLLVDENPWSEYFISEVEVK